MKKTIQAIAVITALTLFAQKSYAEDASDVTTITAYSAISFYDVLVGLTSKSMGMTDLTDADYNDIGWVRGALLRQYFFQRFRESPEGEILFFLKSPEWQLREVIMLNRPQAMLTLWGVDKFVGKTLEKSISSIPEESGFYVAILEGCYRLNKFIEAEPSASLKKLAQILDRLYKNGSLKESSLFRYEALLARYQPSQAQTKNPPLTLQ